MPFALSCGNRLDRLGAPWGATSLGAIPSQRLGLPAHVLMGQGSLNR
jgi:hypothetical protein